MTGTDCEPTVSRKIIDEPFHGLFDLTSLPAGSPARTSQWLEGVLGLLAHEAGSGGDFGESSASCIPSGFLSKTSLGFCQATEDGTWVPFSDRWGSAGMGGPTAA